MYEQPDWGKVHRELARVGVTLRILHGEYVDECRQSGRPHMGYDRFCKLYAAYVARLGVTSRVEHKAGRTIEVDWAGKTMRIVDPVTGDSSTVYLFVAVLPFSRYAFVEPTLDMGQNSWLRAHVAMYEWFGGSTPRLVRDNLKTGVIKHPREGEIVLNDAYRSMADHYSAAVLRRRGRQAVRHGTPRRAGRGARAGDPAAVETLFRPTFGERVFAVAAVDRLAAVFAHQTDPRIRLGRHGRDPRRRH